MPKSFAHSLSRVVALAILAVLAPIALATPSQAQSGPFGFDCSKDVYYLGVPGSGENPKRNYSMGPTVANFAAYLSDSLSLQGRSMFTNSVNYPARDFLPTAVFDPISYYSGVYDGVDELQANLLAYSKVKECQHQRIVIAGYSQGAMVIHRALRLMLRGAWEDIFKRLDGVLLIADADRVPGDNVTYFGGATSDTHGISQEYLLQTKDTSKFPAAMKSKIMSVCVPLDPICGLTKTPAIVAVPRDHNIHYTYKDSSFYATSQKVIQAIKWAFPSDKIVFDKATGAPKGQVYVPLSHQLQATSGLNCTVRYSTASTLPPGVFINPSGLVSGTPTVAGTVRVNVKLTSQCRGKEQTATAPVTFTIGKGPAAPVTHNGVNTGIQAGNYIASVSPGATYAELRKCMKVAGGGSCEIVKITTPTRITIEKRWQVFYGQDLVLMPA